MMGPSETASGQTTNTGKTDTSQTGNLEVNPWYFRTVPGILKLLQLVFAIVCMVCASPVYTSYTKFFMFVVATYFIITFVFCIIYFFRIKEQVPRIPWLLIEFGTAALGTVLYFIAAVVQLALTNRKDYDFVLHIIGYHSYYIAAGCFGLINFVAYAVGTFLLFAELKDSNFVITTVSTPAPTGYQTNP